MVVSTAGGERQINEVREKIQKLLGNTINLAYDKGDILYQMGENDGCLMNALGTNG